MTTNILRFEKVICDIPYSRCEAKGRYWRCYLNGFTKCEIRKAYYRHKAKERKQQLELGIGAVVNQELTRKLREYGN